MDEKVVCRDFRHTTQHGAIEAKTQETVVKYYNLKTITAVGYRVNSQRAIEFRKWATEILHELFLDITKPVVQRHSRILKALAHVAGGAE